MKRSLILALLAAFVLSAGVANAAVTMKTSGTMDFSYGWTDNFNFYDSDKDNGQEDDLMAMQRTRMYFEWAASESLKGVIGFEFGSAIWGNRAGGADLDADERALEIKQNYIDFMVPNTALNIRMGIQPVALPGALGSPIFDYDVAGILATYKFNDMVSATAGWLRPKNANAGGTEGVIAKNDEIDVLALLLPITGNGFTVTPWAAYGLQGQNAGTTGNDGVTNAAAAALISANSNGTHDNVDAWWVGGNFKLTMFDPFDISGDLIYGATDTNNSSFEREGWFFDLAVNYKMANMTPGVFFVYSTGDDDDPSNGSERMPSLGGTMTATTFTLDGGAANIDDWAAGPFGSFDTTSGMWMLGAQLADITFIDKLTHTIRVVYAKGTNDSDLIKKGLHNDVSLTDKDSFWEVNFDHSYAIYENLTAYVETGWIKLNLSDEYDRHSNGWLDSRNVSDTQDAWKFAVALRYKF